MKFEFDENKIESICYKGKYGKKFIIFLEDGVVTDIVDTGVADIETATEDLLNTERKEILTALKGSTVFNTAGSLSSDNKKGTINGGFWD